MKTLKILLKQHTPLIHFQHDQEGATLRASEVKPKLDRFIIEQDYENDFEQCKELLVGYNPKNSFALKEKFQKGYRALNYKIRIEVGKINPTIRLQSERGNNGKYYSYWRRNGNRTEEFPLLLSNMGGKNSEDELINFSFYDEIYLFITCKNDDLYDSLSYYIDLFFANNNFGQRSSKGFGSFSVVKINDEKKTFPNEFKGTHYLQFELNGNIDLSFQNKVFQVIDFYWKCLKSGINYTRNGASNDRYIKAFLWIYLASKKQTWEKRMIKRAFNLTTGKEVEEHNYTPSFARAILGLPDKFEYRNKGAIVDIGHNENPKNDDFIARIPSPIVFKPIIENKSNRWIVKVLLLSDNSPIDKLREISNKTFRFSCRGRNQLLNIDPNVIVLEDLICQYHQHIAKLKFGRKAFRNDFEYQYFKREQNINHDNWFIPLDFSWRQVINSPVLLKTF